jgi:Lon protease-like protein
MARALELPEILPVFPLTGAVLFPRGQLPLNVFEPRYLTMVDWALAGARMIGMVQPTEPEDRVASPPLARVGCAGRITTFREADDGRYLITLTGMSRFLVADEVSGTAPFRSVRADYAPYRCDLGAPSAADFPRDRLTAALDRYLVERELNADWRAVLGAPPETLVNALAMLCPFEPAAKQALLEAKGWTERVETLIVLLELAAPPSAGSVSIN